MEKKTIKDVLIVAKKKKWKLLSNEYKNSTTELDWICDRGHELKMSYKRAKRGDGCSFCSGYKSKLGFKEDMRLLASKKNGKFLSEKYLGVTVKHKWECEFGHQWMATPDSVKHNHWCPECAKKRSGHSQKLDISVLKKYAIKKKGHLLSSEYINSNTLYKWECKNGHSWDAKWSNISQGKWCPYCSGRKKTIDFPRELAKRFNGKLISSKYKDLKSNLLWECEFGHRWKSSTFRVTTGTWCPECNIHESIGERFVRNSLQYIFGQEFNKCRPEWLRYKGQKLELDGYNEELKIAFEHHGQQHYNQNSYIHNSKKDFDNQLERDFAKLLLLNFLQIKLITIPEIPKMTSYKDFKKVLMLELKKNNIRVPKKMKDFKVDNVKLKSFKYLDRLRNSAEKQNGQLLSESYIGMAQKYNWKCHLGHTWEATADKIVNGGQWCPFCQGKNITLEDMQKIAQKHNGKCLSKKYIGTANKLKWQCQEGHIWEAVPSSIKAGSWCPKCAKERVHQKQKTNIEVLKKYAKSKSGKLLSEHYINNKTKCKWKCRAGHEWEASWHNVKRGKWCPICARM